jgi:hypothetical protein
MKFCDSVNAKYSLPIENELQFKSLRHKIFKPKYILLVKGIGEDCKKFNFGNSTSKKNQSAS